MGKRLICEQDVLAMRPGEVLRIDGGTIATPSALDAAFRRGIRVVDGDEGAGARVAGKRPCLWHEMLENDGSYVVQVVNGRATVSLLGEAGPVAFGTDSVQEHNNR